MDKKNIYWALLLSAIILFGIMPSCKKFTEIGPPKNAVLEADVFKDSLSINDAIMGIYTTLNTTGLISGNTSAYLGLSADELIKIGADNNSLQLQNNAVSATNGDTEDLWSSAYQVIAAANASIIGLKTATNITAATAAQYSAEAKFLRAYCYFYLVNLYGNVPLVLTNNYQKESNDSRTASAQIYQQISQDLIEAQTLLPASYATGQYVRATKWAATAMLARVNLYQQSWVAAETLSTNVINNSGTTLTPDPNNVFLINSSETIWQVQPPTYYKNAADNSILFGFGSGYNITNSLLNAFEAGDLRKAAWIYDDSANSGNYLPYKYKANTYSGNTTEYTMMLRLAEQYLIRAEARARQNNMSGAINDLNTIRTRAGLANLSATLTPAQCFAAVEQERRIEFCFEWGNRWLDLKRMPSLTGAAGKTRADDVLPVDKTITWKSTDLLYPIPYNDILLNGNLTQNPGY